MSTRITQVVTPISRIIAWPKCGSPFPVERGERLLVHSSRRSSMGGHIYKVAKPHYDGYLGEYITAYSNLFEVNGESLVVIEDNTNIYDSRAG